MYEGCVNGKPKGGFPGSDATVPTHQNCRVLPPTRLRALTCKQLYGIILPMSRLAKEDILNMSVTERIQLVEDIWDSIAEVPEAISLTDTQKGELDHRLDAYHKNPNEGSPWEEVRKRIQKRA